MMSYLIYWFVLLILSGGVFLEKRFVHQGEKVLLFGNVETDLDKEVSLYMNVDKNYNLIVTWTIKNKIFTPEWMEEKYKKINMDDNRDIWIANVDENYIGKYLILNSSRPEVEIIIFDKRLVYREDNITLFANVSYQTKEVSLCIFGEKNYTLNLTWQQETERDKTEWMTVNNPKIYMDQNGDIRIDKVDEQHTGKYFIQNSSRPGVELIIMVKQFVHLGENVLLFGNVSDLSKEVSLYINGDKNYTLIVSWRIEGDKEIAEWMAVKYTKIRRDQFSRDILIDNIEENYTGKYFILNSPKPGKDLIILGSREILEPDSEKTSYTVIIGILVPVIMVAIIVIIVKHKNVIIQKCRRSEQMDNNTAVSLIHGSPQDTAEMKEKVKTLHKEKRPNVTIDLSKTPRSSLDSKMKPNVKTLHVENQPKMTIDLSKTPRSSLDSKKVKTLHVENQPKMTIDLSKKPHSSLDSKIKPKVKTLHVENQPKMTIDLSKTPRSSLDSRKTKDIKMSYVEDLQSSKMDMQRMGSGTKVKSEPHGMTLRPRKLCVPYK